MATVLTVLRSGGDFNPFHVQAMQRQVERWAPKGTSFVCLSDQPVEGVYCMQLKHDWPGWWAKMEMFRPDLLLGDFLYTDLDNAIIGPIGHLLHTPGVVLNSGVNDSAWTSLMALPEEDRTGVWETFITDPALFMQCYDPPQCEPPFGDAAVVAAALGGRARRWEKLFPKDVVNISTMMTPFGFRKTKDARMILCHRPYRPWLIPALASLYGESL